MDVDWKVHGYKARLDEALAAGRWNEAEQVRIAAKRRLMQLTVAGAAEAVEQARDAMADTVDTFQLSRGLSIPKGEVTAATKLSADAETFGMAAEVVPLRPRVAQNARESVLEELAAGNRRPMSSSELARRTGHRPETIARILAGLREQGQVVSRRMGRHVLHRMAGEAPRNSSEVVLVEAENRAAVPDLIKAGEVAVARRPYDDYAAFLGAPIAKGLFQQKAAIPVTVRAAPPPPAKITDQDMKAEPEKVTDQGRAPKQAVPPPMNRPSSAALVNEEPGRDDLSVLTMRKAGV